MKIQELALQAVNSMIAQGYNPATAWGEYSVNLKPIIKMHEQKGVDFFDEEILYEYAEKAKRRYNANEISYKHYRYMVGAAERFSEFEKCGLWKKRKSGNKPVLNSYYDTLAHQLILHFSGTCMRSDNSIKSYTGCIRHHFSWLENQSYFTLQNVNESVIHEYFIQCTSQNNGHTLLSKRSRLKRSYDYLHKIGEIPKSLEKAFVFHIPTEHKILRSAFEEETEKVLSAIDRSTFIGKRDYAIIMLAAVTGMRSCDIADLRLKDIDWANGEIRIIQQKTGEALFLPLTKDVGEALKDYILYGGRSAFCKSDEPEEKVFLCAVAPYKGFTNSSSIGKIYENRRIKAGFNQNNGIHALRRSVGTNMAIAGVKIDTVSQILGHKDIDSTKQYISLNAPKLKECALSLNGIEVKGGR